MKTSSTIYALVIIICTSALVQGEVISTNVTNGSQWIFNQWRNEWKVGRRGYTNTMTIPEGKQLLIHGVNIYPKYEYNVSPAFIRKRYSSTQYQEIVTVTGMSSNLVIKWNGPLIGPANIEYGLEEVIQYGATISNEAPVDDGLFLLTKCEFLFEIKDNPFQATLAASTSISSTSVVVPSNAVGDVDVLLEQSNDMITWTQCLPGTYNASTQKRFFRVRAVEK